ncbi:hypothetical protein BDK51DRAFT_25511 [Blyttiomyces helicus]|uniref:Uncharacterized protein n=1 Tax=Blyttiomyces helicus TaxID=388810 RepID=A0A4P9WE04_9FUNG|nr:hypothetical protein BDK51DRAFT_25511 [Blyttiomyces helicus]|eukprot:RKO88596.1 hypothetical protein BDK51DRAFT_25511 [Blyttiomyces helicus]
MNVQAARKKTLLLLACKSEELEWNQAQHRPQSGGRELARCSFSGMGQRKATGMVFAGATAEERSKISQTLEKTGRARRLFFSGTALITIQAGCFTFLEEDSQRRRRAERDPHQLSMFKTKDVPDQRKGLELGDRRREKEKTKKSSYDAGSAQKDISGMEPGSTRAPMRGGGGGGDENYPFFCFLGYDLNKTAGCRKHAKRHENSDCGLRSKDLEWNQAQHGPQRRGRGLAHLFLGLGHAPARLIGKLPISSPAIKILVTWWVRVGIFTLFVFWDGTEKRQSEGGGGELRQGWDSQGQPWRLPKWEVATVHYYASGIWQKLYNRRARGLYFSGTSSLSQQQASKNGLGGAQKDTILMALELRSEDLEWNRAQHGPQCRVAGMGSGDNFPLFYFKECDSDMTAGARADSFSRGTSIESRVGCFSLLEGDSDRRWANPDSH